MSTGRNLVRKYTYKKFISSIGNQNYTNFQVIYIDDASNDNTIENMENYIFSEYPELKEKILIISNIEKLHDRINKDKIIKEYCEKKSIIIDLE